MGAIDINADIPCFNAEGGEFRVEGSGSGGDDSGSIFISASGLSRGSEFIDRDIVGSFFSLGVSDSGEDIDVRGGSEVLGEDIHGVDVKLSIGYFFEY